MESLLLKNICLSVILAMGTLCYAEPFVADTAKRVSLQSPNDNIALRKDSDSAVIREDSVYLQYHVDKKAQFPGGLDSLNSFIKKNLCYPPETRDICIVGTVIVQFIIEKNGAVSDVKVIRSVDPLLDKEAVRVVTSMPNWIPAEKDGKAVRSYYTLPIRFGLYR